MTIKFYSILLFYISMPTGETKMINMVNIILVKQEYVSIGTRRMLAY